MLIALISEKDGDDEWHIGPLSQYLILQSFMGDREDKGTTPAITVDEVIALYQDQFAS